MNIKPPYLLYLGDKSAPLAIKMSRGLAHWRPELCIGEISTSPCELTLDLPKLSIDEAISQGAKTFVLGVANSGGVIPATWHSVILEALEKGLNVASGMHTKLTDIPLIKAAAHKYGRELYDIRYYHGNLETGKAIQRSGKRLLTVGTDCSVGKMYTALAIEKEMRQQGFNVNFRATGQSGIIIAGTGICVDAVIADFISGAAETISPANTDNHWDIIEGQGSLFNPSFAGVSLGLLHGAQADSIVMCHEAGRKTIKDLPHCNIPSLKDCIHRNLEAAQLTNPRCKLVGISLNCRLINKEQGLTEIQALEKEFSVPCFDPMITGVSNLVNTL